MAYIAPNSTLRLLHNVPLDPTYENTIYFASATAQASYFAGLAKYTLNQYTYLRKERVIRVGIVADNLYDVNYIMFQNTSFGSKWFYAFVTNIEYINNETAEISYIIDAMQTWLLDINLNPCFIERQHTITDNIGDNLIAENLELGGYTNNSYTTTGYMTQLAIVIAATFNESMEDVVGGEYGGIYSGLYYNVFSDYEAANSFIQDAVSENKEAGIVSIFMMPTEFTRDIGDPLARHSFSKAKAYTEIDGYVPKNKKLFTYPYNFLYVTNSNGVTAEYKYEYFSDSSCYFGVACDMSCAPTAVLYPINYKGVENNYDEKITLSNFPQCAYNIDAFKAWLAQASNTTDAVVGIYNGITSAIGTATGYSNMKAEKAINKGTTAVSLMESIGSVLIPTAQTLSKVYDLERTPPQQRGQQSGSVMAAMGLKDFLFFPTSVRAEFARIIDDYWTKYGYPIHRIGTPNLIARPHWTYIKTIGSDLTGSIPATDMAIIKACFDNGITFWRNGSEVGNYNLDNSPTT